MGEISEGRMTLTALCKLPTSKVFATQFSRKAAIGDILLTGTLYLQLPIIG